jgi:hypothetical protein
MHIEESVDVLIKRLEGKGKKIKILDDNESVDGKINDKAEDDERGGDDNGD